ncbi:MAG TPA: helix-turn-helix domain-containing protein [Ktedonobacteraceae bacterium]
MARLPRQAGSDEVVALYQQGKSIAALVEQVHLSPTTVRRAGLRGCFSRTGYALPT